MSLALYIAGSILIVTSLAGYAVVFRTMRDQWHRVESFAITAPWPLIIGILLIGAGNAVGRLGW